MYLFRPRRSVFLAPVCVHFNSLCPSLTLPTHIFWVIKRKEKKLIIFLYISIVVFLCYTTKVLVSTFVNEIVSQTIILILIVRFTTFWLLYPLTFRCHSNFQRISKPLFTPLESTVCIFLSKSWNISYQFIHFLCYFLFVTLLFFALMKPVE